MSSSEYIRYVYHAILIIHKVCVLCLHHENKSARDKKKRRDMPCHRVDQGFEAGRGECCEVTDESDERRVRGTRGE